MATRTSYEISEYQTSKWFKATVIGLEGLGYGYRIGGDAYVRRRRFVYAEDGDVREVWDVNIANGRAPRLFVRDTKIGGVPHYTEEVSLEAMKRSLKIIGPTTDKFSDKLSNDHSNTLAR